MIDFSTLLGPVTREVVKGLDRAYELTHPAALAPVREMVAAAPGVHPDLLTFEGLLDAENKIPKAPGLLTPYTNVFNVTAIGSVVCVLQITGLIRLPNGDVTPFGPSGNGFQMPITAAYTTATKPFVIASGGVEVVSVSVRTLTPVSIGAVWCLVESGRALPTNVTVMTQTLIMGVVNDTQPRSYPGSALVSSTDSEPLIRNLTGTQPAAGQPIQQFGPLHSRWELVTVFAQYTTSATAGTRVPLFAPVYVGAIVGGFLVQPFSADQGPSSTFSYTWGQNMPSNFQNGFVNTSFPQRQFLRNGDAYQISVAGGAVDDQWFAPVFQVREWLEP